MENLFAIIQIDAKPVPWNLIANIMIQQLHVVQVEAYQAARKCKWILFENLKQTDAEKVNIALNKVHIPNRIIPMERMASLSEPSSLLNADCEDQFMAHLDNHKENTPVDWKDIQLVSVGAFKEARVINELQMGNLAKGIFSASRGPDSKVQKLYKSVERVETRVVVDIVAGGEQPVHFRIYRNAFNYDYLGHRLQLNKNANFKLLVDDLARLAVKAIITEETENLLQDAPESKYSFASVNEFRTYNQWNLQLLVEEAVDKLIPKKEKDSNPFGSL